MLSAEIPSKQYSKKGSTVFLYTAVKGLRQSLQGRITLISRPR